MLFLVLQIIPISINCGFGLLARVVVIEVRMAKTHQNLTTNTGEEVGGKCNIMSKKGDKWS